MNEPQTLQTLVRQALETRKVSGRRLADLAGRAGLKVTHTTLNHLAAGTYKFAPSPETIRAVAWLAEVSEEDAFAAAGVPVPGPPFSDELPPGVDYLSPRSRRAVIEVLRALVEAEREEVGSDADRSAPRTVAGEEPATSTTAGGSRPGTTRGDSDAVSGSGAPTGGAPAGTTQQGDPGTTGNHQGTTRDDVGLAAYAKTGPTRLQQLRAAQDADALRQDDSESVAD
ncbi:hypothetical protein [Litorihabitans aurantiacus]|uniref:hypothetical protein n=1 Tax=Litorihabitans aurantiacus TaxID=1930061 RepID=UPI0024E10671|nr:hypothetical protein [Litorihabitans aurantiacus]